MKTSNLVQDDLILHFIPKNPSITSKTFGSEILSLKNYYSKLENLKSPRSNVPGEPLITQEFASMFFSPYTIYESCLIAHVMGTGKTCLVSFAQHEFVNAVKKGFDYRKSLFLVPNETILASHMSEIVDVCAFGKYKGELTQKEKEKYGDDQHRIIAKRKKKIKAAISEVMVFKTHHTFVSEIAKNPDASSMYANYNVYIDEGHKFRPQSRTTDEGDPYEILKNFLHNTPGLRKLVLTGTPVWDSADEFADLMNLVLNKYEQLETGAAFIKKYVDYDKKKIINQDILMSKIQNKVSYLTASFPIKKIVLGKNGYVKIPLGKYQAAALSNLLKSNKDTTNFKQTLLLLEDKKEYTKKDVNSINSIILSLGIKRLTPIDANLDVSVIKYIISELKNNLVNDALMKKQRDIEMMVFPNMTVSKTKGFFDTDESNPLYTKEDLSKVLSDKNPLYEPIIDEVCDEIGEYSNKLKYIIDYMTSNTTEVGFVYNKSVSGSGGILNMSRVLSAYASNGKKIFRWAHTASDLRKKVSPDVITFVSFSTQTTNDPVETIEMLKIISSKDNKYGNICRLVFGSEKISIGITMSNVRVAFLATPHWNDSELSQALARVHRESTHRNFSPEEAYLNIAYLCSEFGNTKTYDQIVYEQAETKKIFSDQIIDLIRRASWDCALLYPRNAQYLGYNYECSNYPVEKIDKSTKVWEYGGDGTIDANYIEYYSGGLVAKYKLALKEIFSTVFSSSFLDLCNNKLINASDKTSKIVLVIALMKMIENREKIVNKYGFACYLDIDPVFDVYYLKENIEKSTILDSYYTLHPWVVKKKTLEDIYEYLQYIEDEDVFKNCDSDLVEMYKKLQYRTKILFIENFYLLNSLKCDELFPNIVKITTNGVIFHDLYDTEPKGTTYSETKREITYTGLKRIFDGEWRFTYNPNEEKHLVDFLKKKKEKGTSKGYDIEKANSVGVRGILSSKGLSIVTNDKRGDFHANQGTVCSSKSIPELFAIFKRIGYFPEVPQSVVDIFAEESESSLAQKIQAQPKLKFLVDKKGLVGMKKEYLLSVLYLISLQKLELCKLLEEWFDKNDLLGTVQL